MMSRKKIWIFLCFTMTLACRSELAEPLDDSIYGYEYYPLEVGKFRIYEVDSIQFDLGSNDLPIQDSARYYVREEIVEKFVDQTDEDIYRLERYRSVSPEGPWSIQDVITQSRSTNQSFYTENNLRLINLTFPVEKGTRWDGSAFIKDDIIVFIRGEALEMFKGWEYEVLSVDSTETVGDNTYDAVATIQQADSDNIIELRYAQEKYAKGIGLVRRERRILDSYCKYIGTNENCFGKPWRDIAGRGFILRETLVDHN